jgi:hypothetical protein
VSNREEVTEDWRKFHDKGLHNFATSPNATGVGGVNTEGNIIGIGWDTNERQEKCIKSFGGEIKAKGTTGRRRRRRNNYVKEFRK